MARTGKPSSAKDPPLDDAQWVLLRKAYNIRSEQLTGGGPSPVAAGDLVEGLRSGNLRCMRRSIENREEVERVPASFWLGRDIHVEAELHPHLRAKTGPARSSDARAYLDLLCLGARYP